MSKKSEERKKITVEDVLQGAIGSEQVQSLSFEDALGLLEEVVSAVEAGTLSLDQSIGAYERGSQLVAHLRALLSKAEEKLKVLVEDV